MPPPLDIVSLDEFKAALNLTAGGCGADEAEDAATNSLMQSYLTGSRLYVEEVKARAYVAQTWEQQTPMEGDGIHLWPCPVQQVLSLTSVDEHGITTALNLADYHIDLRAQPARLWPQHGFGGGWWPGLGTHHREHLLIEFIAGDLMPITANPTADTVTAVQGRTFAVNERLTFCTHGGVLPEPLTRNRWYYVINPSGSSVQLSLTASGAALDLTTAGSGNLYIGQIPEEDRILMLQLATHLYENRLPVMPGQYYELPLTIKALLWQKRVLL